MTKSRILKEAGIWFLTLLVAFVFADAGIHKFFDHSVWTKMFVSFGFPNWFRILIGVVETAAAALLLVPRTAAWGAATMIVVMAGVFASALTGHVPPRHAIAAAVWLVLAMIVLLARWRQRARVMKSHPLAPLDR